MRLVVLGLLMVLTLAWSDAARGEDAKAARIDSTALARQIAVQMASGDPATRLLAVASMHKLVTVDPVLAMGQFRSAWVPALTEAKMYLDIDEIAIECMTRVMVDGSIYEALEQARVRALLQASKPDRALDAARGLFNVSSMAGTSNSLLLITECLNAAHPGDQQMVERFKAQQIAGATATTAPAETQSGRADESILLSIKTEGEVEPFARAARRITAEDYTSLCAKGNLLLLADQPGEARLVFERAYAEAADGQLAVATENLARCMKAQDGAIGRANAWVLALRPPADNRQGR